MTKDDIFSRCKSCNTESFTLISKYQAIALWLKYNSENPEIFLRKISVQDVLLSIIHGYKLNEDEDLAKKIDPNSYCLIPNPQVRVKLESLFDTTLQCVELYNICDGNISNRLVLRIQIQDFLTLNQKDVVMFTGKDHIGKIGRSFHVLNNH